MGERLRVLVVDDEPLARVTLRTLLGRDAEVEVVGECGSGQAAVLAVREHRPDLVFLDVQMPGLNGFDVLAALDEDEWPLVVFATAFDEYALKAFEVHAVDYLLKPYDDERFDLALERAKARWRGGERPALADLVRDAESLEEEPAVLAPDGRRPDRLQIHREGQVVYVPLEDIRWVEAADQYVRVHTRTGVELMRESMANIEARLSADAFARVHRSAIVALREVRSLESLGGGRARLVLAGGEILPVSRSRAADLRRRL